MSELGVFLSFCWFLGTGLAGFGLGMWIALGVALKAVDDIAGNKK